MDRTHIGSVLLRDHRVCRFVNTDEQVIALAHGLARRMSRQSALRHTAATLLLLDGTPLFDVSRVLGHSEIGTTSDIHRHVVPEMAASAAARMDTLLDKRRKA